MKKMKLFLLAALLIGIGSAFTTVKPEKLALVWATPDHGATVIQVNTADEGDTFTCEEGAEYCLYANSDLSGPIGPQTKQFVPSAPKK